jgi:hypothetical protein
MDIEQRVAGLEENVAVLREIIAALTGGQQALLSGLQTIITESHPAIRSAEMQRSLAERADLLQALPVSDALLDRTTQLAKLRPASRLYKRTSAPKPGQSGLRTDLTNH